MRRVIGARGLPGVKARSVEGYQPGLARYPDDPRAFVDGSRALMKLRDAAKREGAEDTSAAEVMSAARRIKSEPLPSASKLFEGS